MSTALRRLALLSAALLAMAAFAVPVASADPGVEVIDPATGEPCPELELESAPDVFGGCEVNEVSGSFALYQGSTPIGLYETDFDLRIGPDGTARAINQDIGGSSQFWPRKPCDTKSGQPLPWPVQIYPDGNGGFDADITICLRTLSSGQGGAGNTTTFSTDITHFGADGWTELTQSEAQHTYYIRYAHWEANTTVDLIETE